MEKRNLDDELAEQRVSDVFDNLKNQLELIAPNGATVHRKNGFLCNLYCCVDRYVRGFDPEGETFGQLRERDMGIYERRVEKIEEILGYFQIMI